MEVYRPVYITSTTLIAEYSDNAGTGRTTAERGHIFTGNQGTPVSIRTTIWRPKFLFRTGSRFYLFHRIQSGSGDHPTSFYSVDTGKGGRGFPGWRTTDLWLTSHYHLVPILGTCGAVPPLPMQSLIVAREIYTSFLNIFIYVAWYLLLQIRTQISVGINVSERVWNQPLMRLHGLPHFSLFPSPSMSFFNLSAVSFPFLSSYLRSGTKICFYVIKAFNGPIDPTLNGISIEYGKLIEWNWQDNTETAGQKPVPVPPSPSHSLHGRPWDWTQTFPMTGHIITT